MVALGELFDIGCTIKAIVCGQGSTNRGWLTKLQITPTKPYFYFQNHQICCLFDPPHLIKIFRDNLMKYDIEINHGRVRFRHVEEFYEKDSKLP